MKKEVGVWIDHRKAVIVTLLEGVEEISYIESDVGMHAKYSGTNQNLPAENQMDRRFNNHLNKYYDSVISLIKDADSILILGPGEAKIEFEKQLLNEKLCDRVVGVETLDKVTERQLAALVREHFED